MRKLRKAGAVLLLAGVLGSGVVATTMPVLAADTTTASLSELCDRLNSLITWLESQPPSFVRDFLLRIARQVCQSVHCPTCA